MASKKTKGATKKTQEAENDCLILLRKYPPPAHKDKHNFLHSTRQKPENGRGHRWRGKTG